MKNKKGTNEMFWIILVAIIAIIIAGVLLLWYYGVFSDLGGGVKDSGTSWLDKLKNTNVNTGE